MPSLTLQQAAKQVNVPYQTLKKHAQRNKLRTVRGEDGRSIMVTEEDLSAYLATEALGATADRAEGRPVREVTAEIGNLILQLPDKVRAAILDGMPSSPKKPGSSAPFLKAIEDIPKTDRPPLDEVDPHFGFPIHFRFTTNPRWTRSSESTWKLGDATWSWNGLFWEGGGSRAGTQLGDDISPAHPDASKRPLSPPLKADRGRAERT